MRISGYLVGYDDQGKLRHLVVDRIPACAGEQLRGELLQRRLPVLVPIVDLLIETRDSNAPFLCLPALPEEVVNALRAGEVIGILELDSLSEAFLRIGAAHVS